MKEASKQAPDITVGGGTALAAYRAPVGADPIAPATPLVLPPGTNVDAFRRFIGRVADICGDDNVTIISSSDELDHENYMDPSKAHDVSHSCVNSTVQLMRPSLDVPRRREGVFRQFGRRRSSQCTRSARDDAALQRIRNSSLAI